ncbi:MAG: molybdopterin biosynthesis protein [Ardenticatenales bacterium]|nr:molybdopterin biosynthesis protein [Ardenticatenales bacterium]
MSIYLHDIPLDQAQARFTQALREVGLDGLLGAEPIPLDEAALGRVLAAPVWARLSSPHYHAAAMDGFAVRAGDTEGATLTRPLTLVYGTQALYVDTGDALPAFANAVIPIEEIEPLAATGDRAPDPRRPHAIRLRAALPPWKHVRPMGEDMVASQLVLPAGHTLRPVDLGAIAGSGHDHILVARRPRVAVLPTGTELKPIGEPVQSGDIIEYNSLVLSTQINDWGGQATRLPIIPDDRARLREQTELAASDHDLILLNAGSSAGSEDYTAGIVAELGQLLVHGVAVRPGHPVILGLLPRPRPTEGQAAWVPIIGVPGYPVSAALTAEIFVRPLLARWLGCSPVPPPTMPATLTRKIVSPAGDDDYVRVAVGRVEDKWLAAPLTRGAGVISSLVRADGLLIIPRGTQGMAAGTEVTIQLYRSPRELARTILAIGSHDMTLDRIAQFLARQGRRLASANVGSQAGLVALRRGEAHLAGSHLLDPKTGTYNLTAIRHYLPDLPVNLVALVGREQGLLVRRGNPLRIRDLADLARPDVRFVNRQRGAGTRVLLDYHLGRQGLSADQIAGYDTEEYTHLAVAAAVASGRADCGLGIAAAAQALELDFIPLFQERYDLVIPQAHYDTPLLAPLLDLLHGGDLREAIAALPGYDVSPMGTLVARLP